MRVVIIDRSPVFRHGLRALLMQTNRSIEIIEVETITEKDLAAERLDFGFLAIQQSILSVHGRAPVFPFAKKMKVCALVDENNPVDQISWLPTESLCGFIVKTASLISVEAACRAIFAGRRAYALSESSFGKLCSIKEGGATLGAKLAPRHIETLRHLAAGKSNVEIAAAMSISVNTVRIYVSAILRSFNAPNRTTAAILGHRYLNSVDVERVRGTYGIHSII